MEKGLGNIVLYNQSFSSESFEAITATLINKSVNG